MKKKQDNFLEDLNKKNKSFAISAGLIFLIIFFGIIAFLVIISIYGSRKEKIKREIDYLQKSKNNEISNSSHIKIYLKINDLIEELESDLNNFKPSIGKSMKEINDNISNKLSEIYNSNELKEVYLVEERKMEFKEIIDNLMIVKPYKWEKEASFSYNVIKAKSKAIKKLIDEANEEIIENKTIKENNQEDHLIQEDSLIESNKYNDNIEVNEKNLSSNEQTNDSFYNKEEFLKKTVKEIKEILDEKEIKYKSNMKKSDLINLLIGEN